MIKIQYPEWQPKIKLAAGKKTIFDAFRKRWVLLTPEEWVRQNFLQYLVKVKHYPAALIAIEKEIELGDLKKRFDIVVYKNSKPWMMVECKETSVMLDKKVLDQVLRYNMSLKVPYLVITNGNYCNAFAVVGDRLEEIDSLPGMETAG
jgi:hypothetical protein